MNRNRTSHQRVLISALHSFPWSLEGPTNATGFTINESAICPRFASSHLGIKWKCKSTACFFELQHLLRNQMHQISSTFVWRHYNTDHLEGSVIRLPPNWWPEGKWVTTEQWASEHRLQLMEEANTSYGFTDSRANSGCQPKHGSWLLLTESPMENGQTAIRMLTNQVQVNFWDPLRVSYYGQVAWTKHRSVFDKWTVWSNKTKKQKVVL